MEEEVAASAKFRADYVTTMKPYVEAEAMPWEFCKQGILKHVLHENHNSREMCISIYQQLILPNSKSGQHRHMAEEVLYVLKAQVTTSITIPICTATSNTSSNGKKNPSNMNGKRATSSIFLLMSSISTSTRIRNILYACSRQPTAW